MDIGIVCEFCLGTAVLPGADTCVFCRGIGNKTQLSLPDGYFWSSDVFECLNIPEYDDLEDTQRDTVAMLLGAGHVNMNTGSNARALLASYFDAVERPITRAALAALIGEPL